MRTYYASRTNPAVDVLELAAIWLYKNLYVPETISCRYFAKTSCFLTRTAHPTKFFNVKATVYYREMNTACEKTGSQVVSLIWLVNPETGGETGLDNRNLKHSLSCVRAAVVMSCFFLSLWAHQPCQFHISSNAFLR